MYRGTPLDEGLGTLDSQLSTDRVRAVILGGGRGERLFPLVDTRAKAAIPIAGKYRLIDVTLSNCINSGLQNIFILTQFNSDSLHRHITTVYRFDHFQRGSVQVLAAQQTTDNKAWFQGTADAIRKTLPRILDDNPEHVLIVPGDHLYRMDYRELLSFHVKNNFDITVSAVPVFRERCPQLGILRINEASEIVEFAEKPQDASSYDALETPMEILLKHGVEPSDKRHLGSMGLYVFRTKVLENLIRNTDFADFGSQVLPAARSQYRMGAHLFHGYWENIGNIRAFFDANIELTSPSPAFSFFDQKNPMFSRPRFLPGSKVNGAKVQHSILSDGVIIDDAEIQNSVIGVRSVIRSGCQIRRTIMMGAGWYERPEEAQDVPLGIGEGTIIKNAIIDSHVRIGPNVRITNKNGAKNEDGPNYFIREGIVIIPRHQVIPPDTEI